MNAITINNLTVGYGQQTILTGIHCTVRQGQFTALIGANGCGKSTLLKTLNGGLTPDSGSITLSDGTSVLATPAKQLAKKLSMLPQTPVVPEGVTVEQLVAYGRAPYLNFLGQLREADHKQIRLAMEKADVLSLADRPISDLSGGQRQRVWIAMTLAQDTDIILLDEPTTYLDMAHQYELLDLLRHMVDHQNKTIVVVLHDLNQACRYADQLIALNEGVIFDQGEPAKVFNQAMLAKVFNLNASVHLDPETNTPMAIPKANPVAGSKMERAA